MSNIFKTKEITYIDDCRELNYAECMGLITNGLIFNLFNPTDEFEYFKKNFMSNIIKYTVQCDPDGKSIMITLDCGGPIFKAFFIPRGIDGIRINILENEYKISYLKYSIEELEHILF